MAEGVGVGVNVAVAVGVREGVKVAVGVDVTVGVPDGVGVSVIVGELVGVNESLMRASTVWVAATSRVAVGVFVGAMTMRSCSPAKAPPKMSNGMPKLRAAIVRITRNSTLPLTFILAAFLYYTFTIPCLQGDSEHAALQLVWTPSHSQLIISQFLPCIFVILLQTLVFLTRKLSKRAMESWE